MKKLIAFILLFVSVFSYAQIRQPNPVRPQTPQNKSQAPAIIPFTVSMPSMITEKTDLIEINLNRIGSLTYAAILIPRYKNIVYTFENIDGANLTPYDNLYVLSWQPFNNRNNIKILCKIKLDQTADLKNAPEDLPFDIIFSYFKNGKYGELRYSKSYVKALIKDKYIYMSE